MQLFRNLQLLMVDFNGITRDYFWMTLNNMFMCYTVSSSFILIKLHSHMNFEGLVISFLCGAPATVGLIIHYVIFGDINQLSKRFLLSWKIKAGTLPPGDKITLLKFIRSCRPLQMDLGNFGYFKKPASIRIIGKLVYYTVKYLLLMNQRFGL